MSTVKMSEWLDSMDEGGQLWHRIKFLTRDRVRKEYGIGSEIDVWDVYAEMDWVVYNEVSEGVTEDDFEDMVEGIEKLLVD